MPQDCVIESSRLEDTKLEDIRVIDFSFLSWAAWSSLTFFCSK